MKFFLLLFSFYCAFNFVDNSWVTVAGKRRFKKDVENNNNDYIYACGEEFMETKCKCDKNILDCDSNKLQNLNIHIIAENFTVKIAKFNNNGITTLKKKWILPGREYSIQKLDFSKNNISKIENGTFDEFKKLEELILIGNQLLIIDENVFTESLGKTLIHLDLKENKLQEMNGKTFVNLKKLEYLSLSMNPSLMPYLNKNVFSTSLANLKHLDLTWCNISTLEDDVFENLINLESLYFHVNPITSVPTAFRHLPNLQTLDLCHTPLKTLNSKDFGYNEKLKHLYFCSTKNLTSINDCAFCSFPNLETLFFWESSNLTFIHENAFGSISSGKLYSNIKEINIELTNISTISEKLFDWSKADKLYIGTKGYICDCSMAWLINDLKRSDSIFSKKMGRMLSKQKYICKSENIDSTLKNGKICNGKLSELYLPISSSPTSMFNFHWLFLIGIIFGIGILCYVFQKQIIKFLYFQNMPLYENDTDKLFQYSNLNEEDPISSIVN